MKIKEKEKNNARNSGPYALSAMPQGGACISLGPKSGGKGRNSDNIFDLNYV